MRGAKYSKNCLVCQKAFTFGAERIRQRNEFCSLACYRSTRLTTEQRFWKSVSPQDPNSCWIWRGQKNKKGYGIIDPKSRGDGKRQVLFAHRVSFSIHKGDIPDGMLVRHKCDVPACVNPDHLELGTASDNSLDMVQRGRSSAGDHHCHAKLTAVAVNQIRAMYTAGGLMRDIALKFGVARATVGDIINRRTWCQIPL